MSAAARLAGRHALGWLVAANAAGVWLSLLLIRPDWQVGGWTYGRWIPVHLNGQLYGWTALPLVAWLLKLYRVESREAHAATWAWTAALAVGCLSWLQGGSSGKIFLDWSGGALAGLVAAMTLLWLVLAHGWWRVRGRARLAGLVAMAPVPVLMAMAASPEVYPPVDPSTGGPTGSSLLGSTLFVVGLMLLLPATLATRRAPGGHRTLGFFLASWLVFAVTEWRGGSHHDWWQILAMLMLLPWVVLLPRWWHRHDWPESSAPWRRSLFLWWVLLVTSGVAAFFPEVLDRLKFTQGLVAHSHLAMAGFTTSFCACLLTLLGVEVGGVRSVVAWNAAALIMVVALVTMGWLEAGGPGWMVEIPAWRGAGFLLRSLCGIVMLAVSATWWAALRERPLPAPADTHETREVAA